MGKKLAIKGHPTRGKEVIELLQMVGGINDREYIGANTWKDEYYFLDNGYIRAYDWCDGIKFTLEEFLKKYPYKVGDKVVYEDDNDIVVISEIKWDNTVGDIFYNVKRIDEDDCFLCPPELLKSYKKTNMNENKCTQCVYAVNNNHCGLRGFRINFNVNYCSAQNVDKLPNGFELQEDGYFSWVNKKPKYPKTYKECCDVLNYKPDFYDADKYLIYGYMSDKLRSFQKLLICRDAYWKIAGEEMGLDKHWEPDWTNSNTNKYCIYYVGNEIKKQPMLEVHHLLAFPTAKMRDVFYENFKDLIENCKELL